MPVVNEGTAVVRIADDFKHRSARTLYFLRDDYSGDLVALTLTEEQAKRIRPGQTLRVRGRRDGKLLSADIDPSAVTVLAESVPNAVSLAARRVIVLIVDIVDGNGRRYAVDDVCDGPTQLLADHMFGSQTARRNVDGCFQDGSFGVLGFGGRSYPGTAMDVVRVSVTQRSSLLNGVCNETVWADKADKAAVALGVGLSQYQHRMYLLPEETQCAWDGVADLGWCGDNCRAWVRANFFLPCGYPDLIAHELGHNVGLFHARTDSDNDGVSDCEYCDTSDIMGFATGFWRTFNAPHKELMGWLTGSRLIDGSVGGTFQISALEMIDPPYPQVVKVIAPSGEPYWLSYRAAIGYDAELDTFYLDKSQIHRADNWGNSDLITQLEDGATFVDGTGLTVKQLSHSADTATIHIEHSAGNPSYTLSKDSLAFGSRRLDVNSAGKEIAVVNTGGGALPITSIAITGANPRQFAQTNDCESTVPVAGSCVITVKFAPTFLGPKTANLRVTAGGEAGIKNVSLSGTGAEPKFSVSPTTIDFGNVAHGTSSAVKAVKISNTGAVWLPIDSITIGGANPHKFIQTNDCPSAVPVGDSCNVSLRFKPTAPGDRSARLRITPGDGVSARTVSLNGTGS